jgi:hypothetical protein
MLAKYGEMMFMDFGEEFCTEKLSKIMGNITSPITSWPITISVWRHINIAFKRKLCRGSWDTMAESSTSSMIHALQSGHSQANENRIYGLSPDAILGPPEDFLQLFLDASTEWQVINHVVPGGFSLKYQDARMHHFQPLVQRGIIKRYIKSIPLSTPTVSDIPQSDIVALLQTLQNNQHTTHNYLAKLTDSLLEMKQELQTLKAQTGMIL